MSYLPEQIEQLLHEDESTSLDFKREQYEFEGASNERKSELLKDILAFSNAFRRTDAYILVGVEEIRGGKSTIVGVSTQLDDAKLQQFVNSKTQRPVIFSYREATHDGKAIGIIHISVQTRPIYLKGDFGKLRKEIVYIRRGSSTDVVKPDEIAQMGTSDVDWSTQPSMELRLIDRVTGKILGESVTIDKCTWYEVPPENEIRDYRPGSSSEFRGFNISIPNPSANIDFFRDVAAYIQTNSCFPISLDMHNKGISVIQDANLSILIHDPERNYELLRSDDIADRPDISFLLGLSKISQSAFNYNVLINREDENWRISCSFGKIQPGAIVRLQDDIFIGSRFPGEISLPGTVYADNIRSPISVQFKLTFQCGSRVLTVEDIDDMAESFV